MDAAEDLAPCRSYGHITTNNHIHTNIPGNIGRHHGGEGSRQQTRRGALGDFSGQQIRRDRRQSRENRRNEHAHVADVDGQMQKVHHPIEHRGSKHEARINCASDGAAKRIPSTIVKPVQELQKALVSKVLCSTKVKVRIKLVDDRLVSDHSKEANGKGKQANQAQDCELQHGGDAGQILRRKSYKVYYQSNFEVRFI